MKALKSKKKLPKKTSLAINLTASSMPTNIFPELATLVDKAPSGDEWLHEVKFDGYRILAFKKAKNIRLMSRNNKEWTEYFENIVKALKKSSIKNMILDGEVVLLDQKQRSNFQLLQNSIGSGEKHNFIYYLFDILYYDKYSLMKLPLLERKRVLNQILPPDNSVLRYSDHIIGSGDAVFKKACKAGLEGIISKNIDSQYEQRRTKSWVKVKCSKRQEFVIGGFTPPSGARNYFGSLYLGYFDKGQLKFCGNVGTGFNQSSLKNIYDQLRKNIIKTNPFNVRPPGITTATWVKPKLVAEVEFTEWTSEGILRHPSFKGLRTDKPAADIRREREVKIKKSKKQKIYK